MEDIWEPLGKMVLVKKDDDKECTSGGIILPSDSKIPVITCRVLEIGQLVDIINCPIAKISKILIDP